VNAVGADVRAFAVGRRPEVVAIFGTALGSIGIIIITEIGFVFGRLITPGEE